MIHIFTTCIADCGENNRVVDPKTAKGDTHEKKLTGGTKENLAMVPLSVAAPAFGPVCVCGIETNIRISQEGGTVDIIPIVLKLA